MNYGSTIQERFNQTISILKNYWKDYLFLNILLTVIGIIAFILTVMLMSILTGFQLVNISNLGLDTINAYAWYFLLVIIVLIFIVRAGVSSIFIGNFHLTKYIIDKKKYTIKELFFLSYKKLYKKAIIDFWSFVIFGGYVLLSFIIIYLAYKINGLALIAIISGFGIGYYVLYTIFYFSDYYCFDKEKYNFSTYLKIVSYVKNKKLAVFGNILVIGILGYVITYIFELIVSSILHIPSLDDIVLNSISFLIVFFMDIFVQLLISVFTIIYFFIYYRFLITGNTEKEGTGKVENLDSIANSQKNESSNVDVKEL